MSFLVISLYELKQFLQIIMWIAVPVALVTVIITTILHYRRKTGAEDHDSHLQAGTPQPAAEMDMTGNGEAYQNMLHLQKKYITEIEQGHQEHTQVKEEFKKLEKKYIELIAKNGTQSRGNFASPVFQDAFQQKENEILQLKASLLQFEETIRSESEQKKIHTSEINKLGTLLKDMEMVATKARQETEDQFQSFENQLKESKDQQVTEKKAWTAEQDSFTHESVIQKEEIARLRSKLIEQDSAHDVIEEKNSQIGFLQNQLDSRIKNYHHLEYQGREDEERIKDLQSVTASLQHEMASLKEHLESKRQEAHQLQETTKTQQEKLSSIINEHSALSLEMESKISHIESVENSLKELQDHHNQALEQLNNSQALTLQLNENLLREVQRSADLEQKLEFSNRLLMKIYQDLSESLAPAEESQISPQESAPAEIEQQNQDYVEPISLEFEMVNNDSMELQN